MIYSHNLFVEQDVSSLHPFSISRVRTPRALATSRSHALVRLANARGMYVQSAADALEFCLRLP